MKTLNINRWRLDSPFPVFNIYPALFLLLPLLLLYQSLPLWIYGLDATAALPDAGIWSLVLLSVLVFLILLLLSAYLFGRMISWLGLPAFNTLVLKFKELTLWQHYVFYWASFALLLLAAIGCLLAIC